MSRIQCFCDVIRFQYYYFLQILVRYSPIFALNFMVLRVPVLCYKYPMFHYTRYTPTLYKMHKTEMGLTVRDSPTQGPPINCHACPEFLPAGLDNFRVVFVGEQRNSIPQCLRKNQFYLNFSTIFRQFFLNFSTIFCKFLLNYCIYPPTTTTFHHKYHPERV